MSNYVSFNFWRGEGASVGHVGVSYGNANKSFYHAGWPNSPAKANFYTAMLTLPIKGKVISSLNTDMICESKDGKPRLPDKTVTFPVDDETLEKVNSAVESSSAKIRAGKKMYSLTPNTPIFTRFINFIATEEAVAEMLGCPNMNLSSDTRNYKRYSEMERPYHCATEAEDIAHIIGAKIPRCYFSSYSPWTLGMALEKQSGAVVTINEPEKVPGALDEDFICAP